MIYLIIKPLNEKKKKIKFALKDIYDESEKNKISRRFKPEKRRHDDKKRFRSRLFPCSKKVQDLA